MQEQGLTEEEAMRLAAAQMKAKRAIQPASSGNASASPQNDGRGVNYGQESPEEAKERWLRQERSDPQGIYSMGGASASGIFGSGAIPLDDYDPEARSRGMHTFASAQQLQLQQQQMLLNQRLLMELQGRRNDQRYLPPPEEEEDPPEIRRPRLDSGRAADRKLGKKK